MTVHRTTQVQSHHLSFFPHKYSLSGGPVVEDVLGGPDAWKDVQQTEGSICCSHVNRLLNVPQLSVQLTVVTPTALTSSRCRYEALMSR